MVFSLSSMVDSWVLTVLSSSEMIEVNASILTRSMRLFCCRFWISSFSLTTVNFISSCASCIEDNFCVKIKFSTCKCSRSSKYLSLAS
eukprot:08208.XXX_427771_428034_1 [CDS] Oithona nana genome sequencing.